MFDRGDFESTPEDRVIHRDITRTTGAPWDNSNVSDPANWRPMYCGVNWELTDSECEFSWFDMSALPEHYPNKIRDVDTRLNVLNGVHYGDRFMQGVIPGSRLLQTCIFSGPTLVRTDIPHLVLYRSLKKTRPRMAVSLRFHETWASWPDALKAFVPLSK
jgi:hypothetical protein